MKIPVLDLQPVRQSIADELDRRWRGILDNTAFVLGPDVREFEEAFAAYLEAAGCIAVANGTDALTVAVRSLGVQPGDEVLVPAYSFFATAECVLLAGARPVFVDVDPVTLTLDPGEVAAKVGERTVGMIPVHLYGRPCRMDELLDLARRHDLWVVEDAAQAHGARYRGQQVGRLGDLAAWSFYPTKNLGCFGDGGAITGANADALAEARLLANHGQTGRYVHERVGTNSRLDSLQAAVLNCRLRLLDGENDRRRAAAAIYRERLAGLDDLFLLGDDEDDEPVYHQFTLLTPRRDELQAFLGERGIGSVVHYPTALHRLAPMAEIATGELPVAEKAAEQVLCLPMHGYLELDDAAEVAAAVRSFFGA